MFLDSVKTVTVAQRLDFLDVDDEVEDRDSELEDDVNEEDDDSDELLETGELRLYTFTLDIWLDTNSLDYIPQAALRYA